MHKARSREYSAIKERHSSSCRKKSIQSYMEKRRHQLNQEINPIGELIFMKQQLKSFSNLNFNNFQSNCFQVQHQLSNIICFISQNIKQNYQFAQIVQSQQLLQCILIVLVKCNSNQKSFREQKKNNPQNFQQSLNVLQIELQLNLELQQTVSSIHNGYDQQNNSHYDKHKQFRWKQQFNLFLDLLQKAVQINKSQKQAHQMHYQNYRFQLQMRLKQGQINLKYFYLSLADKRKETEYQNLFDTFLMHVTTILQPMVLDFCRQEQQHLMFYTIKLLVQIGNTCWINQNDWESLLKFTDKVLILKNQTSQSKLFNLPNTKKINLFFKLLKKSSQFDSFLFKLQSCYEGIWRMLFVEIRWVKNKIKQTSFNQIQQVISEYLHILSCIQVINLQVLQQLKQLLSAIIQHFIESMNKIEQTYHSNFEHFHKSKRSQLQNSDSLQMKGMAAIIQVLIQILYKQVCLSFEQFQSICQRLPFIQQKLKFIIQNDL